MNKIGKLGEDIACMFLKKHKYKIIERNYLKKWGELDIVAKKAGKLCFVEVKTVSCEISDASVTHVTGIRPEENMHSSKMHKFARTIETYIQEKGISNAEWTASLITVRLDLAKKRAKVKFIDNLVLQ